MDRSTTAVSPVVTLAAALPLVLLLGCGPRAAANREAVLDCQTSGSPDASFVISLDNLDEVMISTSIYTQAGDDGSLSPVVGMQVSIQSSNNIIGLVDPDELDGDEELEVSAQAIEYTDEGGQLSLYFSGISPETTRSGDQDVVVLESDCGHEEWTFDIQ